MTPSTVKTGLQPLPDSCAAISHDRGEPLAGTASRVDVWLLLSAPEPWGAKALPESSLPEAARERLNTLSQSIPNARTLLIKRNGSGVPRRPTLFVALSNPRSPRLYRIPLGSYEELADLELTPFLDGDPGVASHAAHGPLFLVCTNGRRDPCCARLGLPVYRAFAAAAGNRAWQCSHVGGHRFAANAVVLPHGLFYGRLDPGDAGRLATAAEGGRLLLPHLRGRSSYDPPVQAGEILLLEALGGDGLDRLRLLEAAPLGPDRWVVTFQDRRNGGEHPLLVKIQRSEKLARVSCQGEKREPAVHYRLDRFQPGP